MKKLSDNLSWVVILGLLGIIIFMRACDKNPEIIEPKIVTKIDTVYVDRTIRDTVYTPGPVQVITRKLPVRIDTVKVLNDYYAKKVYKDTIKLDGIGSYVVVKDTITENKVASRQTFGNLKYPIVTKETTITIPPIQKNQVYGGFILSGPNLGMGPQLILKTKKDKLFQVGASLNQTGIQYNIGLGWKIKLKK